MIVTDDTHPLSDFYSADVKRLLLIERDAIIARHAARYAAHVLTTDKDRKAKEKIR